MKATRDRNAYNLQLRVKHRADAAAAAEVFEPGGDRSGPTPLLDDGTVDVRAQVAQWDRWANQGAADGPSATEEAP